MNSWSIAISTIFWTSTEDAFCFVSSLEGSDERCVLCVRKSVSQCRSGQSRGLMIHWALGLTE